MTRDQAEQVIMDAHYGRDAAIGDGSIVKMIMELFAGLIGGCGAARAHEMVNGSRREQRVAHRRLMWDAYLMTGNLGEANRIADTGMKVGSGASLKDFKDMANMVTDQ